MLLALLRLHPKKWSEYLKDMGHRFPRNPDEYQIMQEAIVRERTLETQVGTLHTDRAQGTANPGMYVAYDTGWDPMPLYLCLVAPAGTKNAPISSSVLSRGERSDKTVSI